MIREFEIRKWLEEQGHPSPNRLVDASVNDLPDRRVWFVPGMGFVKQFAASAQERFFREVYCLQSELEGFARPGLTAFEDLGIRGSLLLLAPAPGRALNDVYESLDEEHYVRLAGRLGQSLGTLHSQQTLGARPQGVVSEAVAQSWKSPLTEARAKDLVEMPRVVADLEASGSLTAQVSAGILDGIRGLRRNLKDFGEAEESWPSIPRGWVHGDVHNENVFYANAEQENEPPTLTFLDFEEAAVAPVHLDLVHPFLNILGEALPGRHFGDERGSNHPIFADFLSAYGECGPFQPRLEDFVPEAVAWYLGIARDAERAGIVAGKFYLETAIASASLLGWIEPLREEPAVPGSQN